MYAAGDYILETDPQVGKNIYVIEKDDITTLVETEDVTEASGFGAWGLCYDEENSYVYAGFLGNVIRRYDFDNSTGALSNETNMNLDLVAGGGVMDDCGFLSDGTFVAVFNNTNDVAAYSVSGTNMTRQWFVDDLIASEDEIGMTIDENDNIYVVSSDGPVVVTDSSGNVTDASFSTIPAASNQVHSIYY